MRGYVLLCRHDNAQRADADIVIVGAGLAGVSAANVLGKQWRVTLVDPRRFCPPVFRAEKIEPDQADLARELGLAHALLPNARRVHEIQAYYRNRRRGARTIEQYGASYSGMVNALLRSMPDSVQFKLGRVVEIANSPEMQSVQLASGEILKCRLIVLASGSSAEVLGRLRLCRVWLQKNHSFSVGFNIQRQNGQPFPFEALTCASASSKTGIDYITFFPIEDTMRANLFGYPTEDVSWLQRLTRDPNNELRRIFPNLERSIGEHKIVGKVDVAITHLYRTEGELLPGVVLIGDASQNTSPPTGRGLTKIFTDVLVLRDCVPRWFETPGISLQKVAEFLEDPRKNAADTKAAQNAAYRRNACCARTLQWRIHRTRQHLRMQFALS